MDNSILFQYMNQSQWRRWLVRWRKEEFKIAHDPYRIFWRYVPEDVLHKIIDNYDWLHDMRAFLLDVLWKRSHNELLSAIKKEIGTKAIERHFIWRLPSEALPDVFKAIYSKRKIILDISDEKRRKDFINFCKACISMQGIDRKNAWELLKGLRG